MDSKYKTQLAGWVRDTCALNSDEHYSAQSRDGLSLLFVHNEHGDTIEYDHVTQKLHVSAPVFTYGIPVSPLELIEAGEAMALLGRQLLDGGSK